MRKPHRTIIMSPCPHTRPHTLACVLAAASAWWSPEHELAVAEVWMCTNHQPRLPRTRAARSTTAHHPLHCSSLITWRAQDELSVKVARPGLPPMSPSGGAC